MTFLLYSFRRCPYAMRARMALAVAGLDPEHREIDLKDRPAHLRELSPKATVPVLQLEDGSVIDESLNVMRWALAQNDPEGWLPHEEEAAETDRWIAANDGEFKHDLDRFKYADRYEDSDPLQARDRAERFVIELDGRLRSHRYLLRDTIALVDVAIFPFVRQFAAADRAWFDDTAHSKVHRWLADWEADPLFRAIMTKIAPWQPGDPAIGFAAAYGRSTP